MPGQRQVGRRPSTSSGRRLPLVAAVMFVAMVCLTLPVAQLDPFMARLVPQGALGYERTAKSFFVTAHFLAYVLFAFLWGALSDRIGRRKPFIVLGLAGGAVFYLLFTIITDLPLLYLARFIEGGFSVMAVSLIMTSGLDLAPPGRMGMTMGVVTLAMLLGNALGAPLGGALGNLSVFYPFYLGAALYLVGVVLALLLPEVPIHTRPETLGEALSVLREEKRLAIPYAYSLVERFTVGFFVGVFPVLMSQKFGASPGRIGILQGIFLGLFALLSPVGGLVADRWGRVWPLTLATIAYGVVLWLVGTVSEGALIPVMVLGGFCGAMLYPPTIALCGDFAPEGKRGVAMGGFNVFGSIGFAIGPVLLGLVGDLYGGAASTAAAGLTCVLTALVGLPFLRRGVSRVRPHPSQGEGPAQV